MLHHRECKSVLGIDNPNENEAISLDLGKGHVQDIFIIERLVGDSDATSRVGRAELPWRIDRDHVKESPCTLELLLG